MKILYTKHRKEILVSDSWYDTLKSQKWSIRSGGYAGNVEGEYMHRIIMGFPEQDVDHIDGNKLNNQVENLRLATESQNIANSKVSKNNKCGYKGVYSSGKRWRACVMKNGKTIHLGRFDTPEDAAKAYDIKALELFGEFARLNFYPTKIY